MTARLSRVDRRVSIRVSVAQWAELRRIARAMSTGHDTWRVSDVLRLVCTPEGRAELAAIDAQDAQVPS
jgi:hypothetical protein